MTKNNINRLYTYFIIYAIAQGIMDAYEEAIETPYLKRAGLDLGWIGIMQSIDFLPWCVKFLFAIPTDSFDFFGWGHRRPYVVMGLLVATVAFITLGFLPPQVGTGTLYMLAMIVRNSGIAVSDCAVNGLSVDAQVDSESGTLSGWMSLGRTIGTVMCCCVAGVISREYGYKYGIIASGIFVVIPLPANWFIVEEWDDSAAFKDKIEGAAVAATGAQWKGGEPGSADKSMALLAGLAAGSPAPAAKSLPVWEAPLPFPDAAKPKGWAGSDMARPTGAASPRSGSGSGEGEEDEEEGGDPKVSQARKLVRRPSFIQRVAESAGFDWDLLMELLSQRHVWMFLLYICFTTLGVAVANFSLAAWLESEHAFEADKIGFAMSAMSVGCFVASLPLGYLFDYLPYKRAMLFLAAASCAGANLTLAFCKTENEAYWGLVFFGAAHGAIFVVQCSMARILADSRVAGVLFGIVDSCCNSMHLVGTAFTGYIATHFTTSCEDHQNWLEPRGFCEPANPVLPTGCMPTFCKDHLNATWPHPSEKEIEECMHEFDKTPEGEAPILWCDYNLTFYVATVIDVWAIVYVFLIPGDKLRVDEGNELKILPHRTNPVFSEAARRQTVMNTTTEQLRSGEISALSPAKQSLLQAQANAQAEGFFSGSDSSSAPPASAPAAAAGQELYGIELSAGLRSFITSEDGLRGAAAAVYVPAGGAQPATFKHNPSHTAALQAFGLLPRALPADAPLSAQLMAGMTAVEPPSRLAPRRASMGDALSAGGDGSGSGSSAASPRKNSVAAAAAGAVSTTGSAGMMRLGGGSSAAASLPFDQAWEAASAAGEKAGAGASAAGSVRGASKLGAAPGAKGGAEMSVVNPMRSAAAAVSPPGAAGGGAALRGGDETMEWKPKSSRYGPV